MVEAARANAQAEVSAAQAAVHRVESALEEQMQYLSMAEKEVCYIPWDSVGPVFGLIPLGNSCFSASEIDLV